jgi:hypothetical protein
LAEDDSRCTGAMGLSFDDGVVVGMGEMWSCAGNRGGHRTKKREEEKRNEERRKKKGKRKEKIKKKKKNES